MLGHDFRMKPAHFSTAGKSLGRYAPKQIPVTNHRYQFLSELCDCAKQVQFVMRNLLK
jgi:hypothetical protein